MSTWIESHEPHEELMRKEKEVAGTELDSGSIVYSKVGRTTVATYVTLRVSCTTFGDSRRVGEAVQV